MKHERILINIAAAVKGDSQLTARKTIKAVAQKLSGHGFKSLELEMAATLKDILGIHVDQTVLPISDADADDMDFMPTYVSCLAKNDGLVFIDLESVTSKRGKKEREQNFLELDIYANSLSDLRTLTQTLTSLIAKFLKLPKNLEILRGATLVAQASSRLLMGKLSESPPVDERHYGLLIDPTNRNLLRELKRRGSVLERDFKELCVGGLMAARVKQILEKASLNAGLVEKKFAIVCRKTKEIIFLLPNRKDVLKANDLECPKCSKKIATEAVMPHYGVTESLKGLLDRSRWMPVFVKQALINLGVDAGEIFTEVKHGEDEIDLLVFCRDRVLIFETKDRAVNLNDAYKLSAKTSRIESVLARARRSTERRSLGDSLSDEDIDARMFRRRAVTSPIIPVVVSTQDVAKDARDLLIETKEESQFLENCQNGLPEFLGFTIDKIDRKEARGRFAELTSTDEEDSATSLAQSVIRTGFQDWRDRAWPVVRKKIGR